MKSLDALLQREYAHELKNYKIHKKIANMICDMGFIVSEQGGKHQYQNINNGGIPV